MTTTKRRNRTFSYILSLIFIFQIISCKAQSAKNIESCLHSTDNTNIEFDFENNILRNEFKDFYESKNEFDIIILKHKVGDDNYVLKRWSINESCIYKEIQSDKIEVLKTFNIERSEVNKVFKDFNSKSIFESCIKCYDCEQYVGLIKKGSSMFIFQLSEKIELSQDIRLKTSKDIILFLENHRF